MSQAADAPACPVIFIRADLGDADAPAAVMAEAIARLGRVDCLVNAAALTDRASLETGTLAEWDRQFAVNARAPFFLMQAAVADMKARRAPGAIVNILSVNAHCGAPELAIYSATKGALSTLTKNTANAHLADRIRVNGINMGWVATPAEQQMQAHNARQGRGLGQGRRSRHAARPAADDGRGGAARAVPAQRRFGADDRRADRPRAIRARRAAARTGIEPDAPRSKKIQPMSIITLPSTTFTANVSN